MIPDKATERKRISIQLLESIMIQSFAIKSKQELVHSALALKEKEEIVRHFNLNKTLLQEADAVILQEMNRSSKRALNGGLNFRELSEKVAGFGFNWQSPDLKKGLILQDEHLIFRLKEGARFIQINSEAVVLSTGRILPTIYQLDNLSELSDQNPQQILLALGFWESEQEAFFPDPRAMGIEDWDDQEKRKVIQHLKAAGEVAFYMGSSWCRFHCGEQNMGSKDLTDGLFYFPEGLVHYVEKHNVRPPQAFIDWVLKKEKAEQLLTVIREIQNSPFRGKQLENHLQRQIWDSAEFTVDLDWWIG